MTIGVSETVLAFNVLSANVIELTNAKLDKALIFASVPRTCTALNHLDFAQTVIPVSFFSWVLYASLTWTSLSSIVTPCAAVLSIAIWDSIEIGFAIEAATFLTDKNIENAYQALQDYFDITEEVKSR